MIVPRRGCSLIAEDIYRRRSLTTETTVLKRREIDKTDCEVLQAYLLESLFVRETFLYVPSGCMLENEHSVYVSTEPDILGCSGNTSSRLTKTRPKASGRHYALDRSYYYRAHQSPDRITPSSESYRRREP
jgi:hypothetical protein